MNPPRSGAPQRSLKARALQWLAQREQSRAELRRKLMPHAMAEVAAEIVETVDVAESAEFVDCAGRGLASKPESAGSETPATRVESVLDWLEAHKYLSSERFVESRVHARAARFGNLRIRQELKQHQLTLPPDTARTLASSEVQRARQVRARKFEHLPQDRAERAKQARFLAARGFSSEAINLALRGPGRSDEDGEAIDPGLD